MIPASISPSTFPPAAVRLRRYTRVAGVLVEPLKSSWVAYSPASGETLLLNDESAAILEVLQEGGPYSVREVAAQLSEAAQAPIDRVQQALDEAWPRLLEAGLIQPVSGVSAY